MAIKINFDVVHNPEVPTIILAKKNGQKLGLLNAKEIEVSDSLNDASEITFVVHKYVDGKKCELWEQIVNFKLVYCVEWDMWFEINVELDEATETKKTVFCTRLGHAELSQIMLYNIEINTENDIAREDYVSPTILYNASNHEASLLHRIMEKAQHYRVIHVDSTIAKIQRTFTFNDTSIYDAFQRISEEIHCLFVLHSNSDENGNIQRTISVYDLESNCLSCGHRGEFTSVCPECGSSNINEGYGNDTTIFITSDELADDIQLSSDVGSIKNCFKLEAGDDLMTATIRNCNPNGSDYVWYISDTLKEDMSQELVSKINSYDNLFNTYQKNHTFNLNQTLLSKYNALVDKYLSYNGDLEKIQTPIIGYPALMNAYYNTIDLAGFLQNTLMPTIELSSVNAQEQAARLTAANLSPISINTIADISLATANNAVLSMANVIVDSRYRVKVATSELTHKDTYQTWTGNFTVTNYSDADDTATSPTVSVIINDNYSDFVQQKIKKSLKNDDTDDLSISGLFAKSGNSFKSELKKYSLSCLSSFYNSCQTCIDILIEQGVGNKSTWDGEEQNLYEYLYVPYLNKLAAIESEMKVRQNEIDLIVGVYDINGELKTYGLQNYIDETKFAVQEALDFQSYLGSQLWLEFCTFRREDKFSNSNYISDGLNNAELFKRAYEFIYLAQKEIYKSAELQHSISTSLKNLLTIKKFKSLVNDFEVGNWLRIMVDDELYKLRLIRYTIDYDNLDNIAVEFSDVVKADSTIKSVQDVISQATSMATSYDSVRRQAQQGEDSKTFLKNWVSKGLDVTNTMIISGADNQAQIWDEHGMLFKKYDSVTETFDDIQLKIINSTLAITDDNWRTVKTAVGAYYYFDPKTRQLTRAYGVNAETLVGKLILGEQLGIYNENGSLSFDNSGFKITNGINSFTVNPNEPSKLLAISTTLKHCNNCGYEGRFISECPECNSSDIVEQETKDVLFIDENGKLHITGDGAGIDVSANSDITGIKSRLEVAEGKITSSVTTVEGLQTQITQTADAIRSEVSDKVEGLQSNIEQTAGAIRSEVSDDILGLQTQITQTADAIRSEVSSGNSELQSQITQTANSITTEVTDRTNAYNELSSKIEQATDSIRAEVSNVQTEVSNIQIGGRNLLRHSKELTVGKTSDTWRTSNALDASVYTHEESGFSRAKLTTSGYTEDRWLSISSPLSRLPDDGWIGKQVTLSVYMRSEDWAGMDAGGSSPVFWRLSLCKDDSITRTNYSDNAIIKTGKVELHDSVKSDVALENSKWVRVSITWTLTKQNFNGEASDFNAATYMFMQLYLRRNGECQIYAPKLEFGNTATDWTPAPEDVDNNIEEVRSAVLEITPEAIISTVTSSEQYKGDISGLSERLYTAEQKITADAIISTVTSSEKYQDDIKELDSKISTVTQTAEELSSIVESISREEVIAEVSDGSKTLSNNYSSVLASYTLADIGIKAGDEITWEIYVTSDVQKNIGLNIDFKKGTNSPITKLSDLTLVQANTETKLKYTQTVPNDVDTILLYFYDRSSNTTSTSATITYRDGVLKTKGGAEYVTRSELTQTASSIRSEVSSEVNDLQTQINQNTQAITLRVTAQDMNAQINTTASEIRSEVNSSVNGLQTSINQNAQNIALKANKTDPATGVNTGSNVLITESEVKISTGKFNVNITGSDSETNALSIDEDGAYMSSFTAPNVAVRYSGSNMVYVTKNPTNFQLATGDCYASLSEAISALNNKYIDKDITIRLTSNLIEYANLELRGTMGGGSINIEGDSNAYATVYGSIGFYNNVPKICLKYININTSVIGIRVFASQYIDITNCIITGSGTNQTSCYGIRSEVGSYVYVAYCKIYNAYRSLYGRNGGIISAVDCTGNCNVGVYMSTMYLQGTMPCSGSTWSCEKYAGEIYYQNANVSIGNAPSNNAVTVDSKHIQANLTGSYYNSKWRSDDSVIRQGIYSGNRYAGCMWFSNSEFSGKTIKSASLTLTRMDGSGRAGAVKLHLYAITLSSKDGNPHTNKVDCGEIGTIGNGETKTFDIPLTVAQSLANGTVKGFMLYASDTSHAEGKNYSANYCKIVSSGDTPPSLTVNY